VNSCQLPSVMTMTTWSPRLISPPEASRCCRSEDVPVTGRIVVHPARHITNTQTVKHFIGAPHRLLSPSNWNAPDMGTEHNGAMDSRLALARVPRPRPNRRTCATVRHRLRRTKFARAHGTRESRPCSRYATIPAPPLGRCHRNLRLPSSPRLMDRFGNRRRPVMVFGALIGPQLKLGETRVAQQSATASTRGREWQRSRFAALSNAGPPGRAIRARARGRRRRARS
jgi:hypothetical protein